MPFDAVSLSLLLLTGLVSGILAGFLGIGGGTLLVPAVGAVWLFASAGDRDQFFGHFGDL